MLGRQPGEALWPEKADAKALAAVKANVTDIEWWPVYQQLPRSIQGSFFLESDFEIVHEFPKGMRWHRYMDLALGKNSRSDYNACVAVAHDPETGTIYVRDMIRIRELTEFMKTVKDWMLSDGEKGTIWAVEDVAFQTLVFREFMKDADLLSIPIMQIKPEGNKVDRARPVQTRGRQGLVKLVNGPWVKSFINEALNFSPNAKKDDQIDSLSGGLAMAAVPQFDATKAVA